MNNENNLMIGLEIHCQLNTKSKLFCSCSSDFRNDKPNTHICPICFGLPGTLPVLNKKAIIHGIKIGLALNCEIQKECVFCRKNYYYPDLVKAFQITMGDKPIGINGYLNVELGDNNTKKISISRIHLEEDPGRLVHVSNENGNYTLVDYNRSGIPLIEIVTNPDIQSPKEARLFLNKLRLMLEYLDVVETENEGSLRVDANISFSGYNRVEIKNISSYKGVEKALLYEMKRQEDMIKKGEYIKRETRHYHEDSGITTEGRSKETAMDYRYFPEPDLPIYSISSFMNEMSLPELPDQRCKRVINEYHISKYYASVLTSNLKLINFYEKVACINAKLTATLLVDILIGELNFRNLSISNILKYDTWIIEWINLLNNKIITEKSSVSILRFFLDTIVSSNTIETPLQIMEKLNLRKESIELFKDKIIEIINNNEKAILDHQSGKKGALNYVIGIIMKETKGKIDPSEINKIVLEIINNRNLK